MKQLDVTAIDRAHAESGIMGAIAIEIYGSAPAPDRLATLDKLQNAANTNSFSVLLNGAPIGFVDLGFQQVTDKVTQHTARFTPHL